MLVLKNCLCVVTPYGKENLSGVDILVENNLIKKIGKNIAETASKDARVIDCSTLVATAGFVNTHHHFYQTLTRNLPAVQDAKLFDWLVYLYEIWKNIDNEAVHYSSLLAMAELLKTGCTTSTDHHYLYPSGFAGDIMSIQFDAAEKLGLRFSPTRGSMSCSKKDGGLPPDSCVQTEDEILEDCERVINKFHDPSPMAMRKIVLAPCSPFSVTPELMKETAKLARKHKVNIHTHVAETFDENDYCLEKHGVRPLKLMEECGFLGEDVSYAHGIHFNDEELDILKKTGTYIAHCPASNMRLGSGICRVHEMLKMGVNVALAVDGSASNDSSDYLGEMRLALLLQRVKYGSDAITAADVYKMATENGAGLLNFKGIGKLEEGYAADIALFNVNRLDFAGSLSDPAAALLFCGYNHQTEYTIVNGKVVVDKGSLVGFDEEEIVKNANRISKKLMS
ncbi:MAG: 8-oxoguanine deaminase [Alphaproteobacteria bacterium]